ncbi:hypothetical protein [Gluconobacter potus]|nr:hypothetical protein [Gluconobacter potus]
MTTGIEKLRVMGHRLTSGLAGWLTYQQMSREILDYESSLRGPLDHLAAGNNYKAYKEFPLLRKDDQIGSSKKIDFAFYPRKVTKKSPGIILMETKYNKNGTYAGLITSDIKKMMAWDIPSLVINAKNRCTKLDSYIEEQKPYGMHRDALHERRVWQKFAEYPETTEILRCILFVWRGNNIFCDWKKENEAVQNQFTELFDRALPKGVRATRDSRQKLLLGKIPYKQVLNSKGSLRAAHTKTNAPYWCCTLFETPEWKNIKGSKPLI